MMYSMESKSGTRATKDFVNEFVEITGVRPKFDADYRLHLERLVEYLSTKPLRQLEERRREFLGHVNWKFRLNHAAIGRLYAMAASLGFTFHFHQKCRIQHAFDLKERDSLAAVFNERGIPGAQCESLLELFIPVDDDETLGYIKRECDEPSKLRREVGDRDIAGEIIKAQFSSFMWVSLSEPEMHRFFDRTFSEKSYRRSFWEYLQTRSPQLFNRENALHVVRLSQSIANRFRTIDELRNGLSSFVARLYEIINNYGFLAVVIEPMQFNHRSVEWEVAADLTLFAEKHHETPLKQAFFRWEQVRNETVTHVPVVDVDAARFDLINDGFTYRDCFVLTSKKGDIHRLLLLFQKNQRDETPLPCPTCRSSNVQGNSYSSLGVRSWECKNLLCPGRSKYNRGKRYSFRGLTMQQAIDEDQNEISSESVRRWTRDVIPDVSDDALAEMLVRHYSMSGDAVHVHNWEGFDVLPIGRRIIHHQIEPDRQELTFWDGPFFKRYVTRSDKRSKGGTNLGDDKLNVLLGDSAEVLPSLPSASFDGAVTSPPYYNAREYAQWPNMYCHLHDMFDINSEVFRVLKPGAEYFYNVFDYFDNERTIVFSAMGQRRMILSAYTVDLFRRIGFELLGNIVWDKGDIEGKRGFNAGNFSPFYQSPFNCWEHVLVFRKPVQTANATSPDKVGNDRFVSRVLRQTPVIKFVRGENVHGHTAPFPDALPELLLSRLPKTALVLDPFGGSLTTGRVAARHGIRSVCIERSEEYCRLGLRMSSEERAEQQASQRQLALF